MAQHIPTNDAPLTLGRVILTVHDLDKTGAFYEHAVGLQKLSGDSTTALYGADDNVLLELNADRGTRKSTPREAGLFHTAFLLPQRSDLGAWLHHASANRFPLQGASDHLVSEAMYLADPEGNGVEIYIDRPRSEWTTKNGEIQMSTDYLDLQSVADTARGPWAGAPEGTVVGHVHLQVGQLAAAEDFYANTLGFEVTNHYPGANFYGSGGYHHHLASNVWNSRNAGPRDFPATGLRAVEIVGEKQALDAIREKTGNDVKDPWGTSFLLTEKEF